MVSNVLNYHLDVVLEKNKKQILSNTIKITNPILPIIISECKRTCDYMIPACEDETLAYSTGTDFTLRLHGGMKFHSGKTGWFTIWYLLRKFSPNFSF